jgi:beta-lactamase superfamily II metal-dependent hydrolase
MSSKKPNPFLVVLDVGHGSAAVLHDEGGTVVFDTGSSGASIKRHLHQASVRKIEAMFLSHADKDHVGGAVTLLLDGTMRITEVLMNSDPSKDTIVFQQLRYALAEANERHGTKIDRRLATSTTFSHKGVNIEVLHPSDAVVLAGVGSKAKASRRLTSNSMSAAIRISAGTGSSVLLGGDIEHDCLDGWKERSTQPNATLIFPHHGGLPGTSDELEAELFAFELTQMVNPEFIVFSNHKTKFDNPRQEIVTAITKAKNSIQFACTQLPQRLHTSVKAGSQWSLHNPANGTAPLEGSICLEFLAMGVCVTFGESP